MGGEWKSRRLADVATVVMGQSPPGATYNEERRGLPFFQGVKDFSNRFPRKRVYCTAPTRFAEPGDILFSVRAPIGEINRAAERYCIGRGLAAIRGQSEYDTDYLEYVLRSIKDEWHILEGQGAVFGNAKKSDLENLIVPWPDEEERCAIARILGTLDDKIELNRRMNETLEAMAQALFKSWFVDFDPVVVNAIRAGNPVPDKFAERAAHYRDNPDALGLPEHILRLFPDRFVDSELGPIPDGWEISKLGDVADVNWGDTNVTKRSYVEDGFIAYSAKGPDGFLPYYDYDRTGVVLSAIGANSGYTWLALGKWSCIKNTIRFWSTDKTLSTEYLFQATYGKHHWPLRGSAQPFISQGDAKKVHIIKPASDLGKRFGQIVRPFHEKVHKNSIENNSLTTLRDSLLPKLISGELRVPDVEKILEDIR